MAAVMANSLPGSLNTAFERLKNVVSQDDARLLASTSMEDVWTTAREIERHLELKRSLRGLNRIRPFLAGIEQYSKVIEVLCNQTPYLPFLWVGQTLKLSSPLTVFQAPIRLLLQVSTKSQHRSCTTMQNLIDACSTAA